MNEQDKTDDKKTIAITVTSLLVALLSPVGLSLISHPLGEFAANLMGVFWSVFIGSPIPIDGGGMVPPTVDPTSGILGVPLIALRLLFVVQIYRAYKGKTSRGMSILWGILSELYLVIINISSYINSIVTASIGGLYIPLPFLLLVGALLVWMFPPFVPSTPWDTQNDALTPTITE